MRLFRRKVNSDAETDQCPYCREPLPYGATKCMMCGSALPRPATPRQGDTAPAENDRPDS
jgi:hypothetical protein